MKGDITNIKQLTVMTNCENISVLTDLIGDLIDLALEDRRLVGYYSQKIASLTDMINGYAQESLTYAKELEIVEEPEA